MTCCRSSCDAASPLISLSKINLVFSTLTVAVLVDADFSVDADFLVDDDLSELLDFLDISGSSSEKSARFAPNLPVLTTADTAEAGISLAKCALC